MRSLRDIAVAHAELLRDELERDGLISDRAGVLAGAFADTIVAVAQVWLDQQEIRNLIYAAMASTGNGGPMTSAQRALVREAARI